MITKPHFYQLRSRLGMINPPWKHEGLNIGVENGAEAVLSEELVRSFPGSRTDIYEFPLPESFPKEKTTEVIAQNTQKAVELINSTIREGDTQVVAGGDHSVSLASITALTKRIDPSTIACIRIDSHPDLLNEASTTTNNFHGMWFRPFLETYDNPAIEAIVGNRKLKPEQVILIGNLDAEDEESALLKRFNIKTIGVDDLRNNAEASQQYIKSFMSKYPHIHLNVDIDGFDKSVAPATGLPSDDGLLPTDLQFMFDIIRSHPSISIDLLEVNPHKPGGEQTVSFTQSLLTDILK